MNASAAGIANVHTVNADVARWMIDTGPASPAKFDLILLAPPDTGAGIEVMQRIANWAPETILYVSCNLPSLIKDLGKIPEHTYKIDSVSGLDLFPQTCRFGTVVRLIKV